MPGSPSLPPALTAFMRDHEFALLFSDTTDGAVLVLKAPRADIESLRGPIPILVRYELHDYPTSPVIRLVIAARGPDGPGLVFETFCNPADPEQMRDLEDALRRPYLRVLCYDEGVVHRLSKRTTHPTDPQTRDIPRLARRLLARIAPDVLDWDTAKARCMAANPLGTSHDG